MNNQICRMFCCIRKTFMYLISSKDNVTVLGLSDANSIRSKFWDSEQEIAKPLKYIYETNIFSWHFFCSLKCVNPSVYHRWTSFHGSLYGMHKQVYTSALQTRKILQRLVLDFVKCCIVVNIRIKKYTETIFPNPTVHEICSRFFRDVIHKKRKRSDFVKSFAIMMKKSIDTTRLCPAVQKTWANFFCDILH